MFDDAGKQRNCLNNKIKDSVAEAKPEACALSEANLTKIV
jgi:hypothetical protein